MVKLLLADDEPLVLVGLQSMLKWEDYGVEICATARNGGQALELVAQHRPDLVIADIRMPVKSGLEVLAACREHYGRLPLFIMLTSFEEFQYVREAIRGQAVDYLVKLELTPESLAGAVTKALSLLRELRTGEPGRADPASRFGMQPFYDRFFVRLFNNLFESEEQFQLQRRELGVDFSFEAYAVCYCEMRNIHTEGMSPEKLMNLYASTTHMVWETVTKYMACYITSLDMRHFNITFCLSEQEAPVYRDVLRQVLEKTTAIVFSYFSVRLACSVGAKVAQPLAICDSFYTARQTFPREAGPEAIVFYGGAPEGPENAFDMSQYRGSLAQAFQEHDAKPLYDTITKIAARVRDRPSLTVQAMDAACNLLFMAATLLYDGENLLEQIFADEPEGYRCLYHRHTAAEIADWILALRDGVCQALQGRRRNYRERVVEDVKAYIRENLDKKLTQGDVAAVFGFSPNYLSQLFTKCAGCSFVEFATSEKIAAAKRMLLEGDAKVYEVAEKLGFESAFYFSKVFKKATGVSPREFLQGRG